MRLAALLLALVLSFPIFGQSACAPLLDAPRTYTSGPVWKIATADLDGDASPDVLVSGQFGLTVLYGRGETLEPPVELIETTAARQWFIADLNGDTRLDLVAARWVGDTHTTLVLRNLGERRFAAEEVVARNNGYNWVLAAKDFTNDGAPDLLIAREGRTALLLENDGSGHFTAHESAKLDFRAASAGDLDGDGDLDLVRDLDPVDAMMNVAIAYGDGKGQFPTQETRAFSTWLTSSLADLNADGRDDLLALLFSWGRIEVYLGPSTKASSKIEAGIPRSITPGDFNGDGAIDIAVSSDTGDNRDQTSSSPRIMVFLNDRHGGLVRTRDVVGLSQAMVSATADFNRDGILDLVIPASEENVSIIFGRGDGTFDAPGVLQTRDRELVTSAVDLDGDGIDEVISRTPDGLVVGWLTASGTYEFEPLPGLGFAIGGPDAGGTRTIVVRDTERIRVVSRTAPRVWQEIASIPTGPAVALGAGDISGDARHEILTVTHDETLTAHLQIYDESGSKLYSVPLARRQSLFDIDVVDVNHDSKNDVIATRGGSWSPVPHDPDPTDGFVLLLLGRGDGTFAPEKRLLDNTRPGNPLPGDYNGDGHLDLAIGDLLLTGDGNGEFASTALPFHATIAADLNRDGITDLLSSEFPNGASVWQGTRGGAFIGRGRSLFAHYPGSMVVAQRTRNGPPSLLGSLNYAGEIVSTELACEPPRRRRTRH